MPRILALILCCLAPSLAIAAPSTVLVLGDSLSAAHNIPIAAGWVQRLQARLDSSAADWTLVNASISGETTQSGRTRLPQLLRQYQPALVILELGANDGLRGLPLDTIRANLDVMMSDIGQSGAGVLLLGIELPVNYGPRYRDGLRAIYAALARKHDAALVPFLLKGAALKPELMQADGLHPTAAGEAVVAATVWRALAPLLAAPAKP